MMAFLFNRNKEGSGPFTIFDQEESHFYKQLENVITAVSQSYEIQQYYTDDFIENLNLSSLSLLMEPRRINKRFRTAINHAIQNIMWWKDQSKEMQATFQMLLRNSVTFLISAILVLRPTVREHFLRSTGIPKELESPVMDPNREAVFS